ncbi:MAG: dihydrodipicolinate synthase family protein [Chloroflexi bacterium]|nr:dihydrodipicolinate synthase family protein [Chloroflexota bacterium]
MSSTGTGGRFRGVFAIPVTPFDADGALDLRSLRRCVEFCVAAGAGGVVAPVNASEFFTLTESERKQVVETVVGQANGRVPVVAGVTGSSMQVAVEMARHAGGAGADAVMAMPPFVRHPGPDEIVEFYGAVAKAAGVPVWIQDFGPPMGTPMAPALLARLLRDIPGVEYLKEETAVAPQVMSQVKALAGDALKGMMGGMAGRYLLDEYRRGACGTMPACEVTDAHVAVWNALENGPQEKARELFRLLLPLLNIEAMYSFVVYKEVLYRRGIIACPRSRAPGAPTLDETASQELDAILADLKPLLTVSLPAGAGA